MPNQNQSQNQTPSDYQQTMSRINDALFVQNDGLISVVEHGTSTQSEFIRSLKAKIASGQAVTPQDLDTLETRTQSWTQPALSSLQNVRQMVGTASNSGAQ